MNSSHRVVIIGGGFGGLYAARALKHVPVQVTLLDRRNFHLFQPLLYQVATGTLAPGDIASPIRLVPKRQKNVRVLLGEAIGFDVPGRQVLLRDGGKISYDTLVVAAGSETNYFGHDAWRAAAPGLKTVEDATATRSRILTAFENAERETDPVKVAGWLTFVIVGAGPTGVELAGALAEVARMTLHDGFRQIRPSSAKILLIDAVEPALPEYPLSLSLKAEKALQRLGIILRTQCRVTDVRLDSVVIGDLASVRAQGDQVVPGVAPAAMQEGHYVAEVIESRLKGRSLPPFRYRNRGNLATIDRNAAVADFGWLRIAGFPTWLASTFVHIFSLLEF